MKIKGWIYFLSAILGIGFILSADAFIKKEYALSIGFILLMYGLYKISTSWKRNGDSKSNIEQEDDEGITGRDR